MTSRINHGCLAEIERPHHDAQDGGLKKHENVEKNVEYVEKRSKNSSFSPAYGADTLLEYSCKPSNPDADTTPAVFTRKPMRVKGSALHEPCTLDQKHTSLRSGRLQVLRMRCENEPAGGSLPELRQGDDRSEGWRLLGGRGRFSGFHYMRP